MFHLRPFTPVPRTKQVLQFLIAVALGFAAAGNAFAAGFQGLGFLAGASDSIAVNVSDDGSVVVGASGSQPVRWIRGVGLSGLGFLSGQNSGYSRGISGDGSVVVGDGAFPTSAPGFRWTQAGGMGSLGIAPGDTFSSAWGASQNGSVLAGYGNSGAFRWTQASGMVSIGSLPGAYATYAYDMSGDGSVITGQSGGQAFRWTQGGGMAGIGFLPGEDYSIGNSVSRDGTTVVGSSGTLDGSINSVAVRWTAATGMQSLGYLPGGNGHSSVARGVSGDGSLVVGHSSSAPGGGGEAFLWDSQNGMQSLRTLLLSDGLDLSSWQLTDAWSISADGKTIVGSGIDPGGREEGWIAVIPEPTPAMLILAAGLVAALGRRARGTRCATSVPSRRCMDRPC